MRCKCVTTKLMENVCATTPTVSKLVYTLAVCVLEQMHDCTPSSPTFRRFSGKLSQLSQTTAYPKYRHLDLSYL